MFSKNCAYLLIALFNQFYLINININNDNLILNSND